MQVQLTNAEIMQGALVGAMRRLKGIRRKRQEKPRCYEQGGLENAWQNDIEGACGELALAKALGLFWSDGEFQGDDAGHYQVRTTRREDGHLIIYTTDDDAKQYVLVVGCAGTYRIAGWCFGRDAKPYPDGKGQRNNSSHWVPQSALRPMAELMETTE